MHVQAENLQSENARHAEAPGPPAASIRFDLSLLDLPVLGKRRASKVPFHRTRFLVFASIVAAFLYPRKQETERFASQLGIDRSSG